MTEYESDQAETDILGGQYDWVNNKVWLGQLNGGTIYQYEGRKLPDSGSLTSATIGPAMVELLGGMFQLLQAVTPHLVDEP